MSSGIRLLFSYAALGVVSLWCQSDSDAVASIKASNERVLRGRIAEEALKERFLLFRGLVRSNPDLALSLALPEEAVAGLRNSDGSAARLFETHGVWEGEGIPLVEDSKDPRNSRIYLRLHSSEGDLNIHVGRGSAPLLPGSRRFRVDGVRAGEDVAAASVTPLSPAAADTCSATGDQKTIGLLVRVPDSPEPTFTQTQVQSWLFGSGRSLDGYLREASYGQTSASGTVAGWYSVSKAYTISQLSDIRTEVFQQALAQGIDLAQYSRIILFLPPLQGSVFEAGLSTMGCTDWAQGKSTGHASVAWIFDTSSATSDQGLSNVIHEVGHGMGLDHSTSLSCGVASPGPSDGACPVTEYGDPYSSMGQGTLGHYAAPQKYALGWLHDADVATTPVSGTVHLQALSAQGSGTKAVRIPRTANGTDWLWVEARLPIGPYETDSMSLRAQTAGAVIHFQPQTPAGPISNLVRTQLVDIPPGSLAKAAGAVIPAGAKWTDAFSGLTVSVAGSSGSGLDISLTRDSACVSLSPSAITVSGDGGTGSIQVTAASGCSWSAASDYSWLTIQGSTSGVGNGTLKFQAAANSGAARQGLIMIGSRAVLVSQPSRTVPPVIVGASPTDVSGPSALLRLTVSDAAPKNYASVSFNITAGSPELSGCMVSWSAASASFRLMNDDGATWSNPVPSGYDVHLENKRCAILSAFAEFGGQDDSLLSLVVRVVLKNSAVGTQMIYLRALDVAGNDTGWRGVGSWIPAADRAPAQPVVPSVPGAALQHAFVIQAADPDGISDLQSAQVDIGSGSHLCSIAYLFYGDGVSFLNDDGTRSAWVAGIPKVVANTSCSVDLLRSSASVFGNTQTVILPVTFKSALTGQQPVKVTLTDWFGQTSQMSSTWNVTSSPTPPVISLSGIVNAASFAGHSLAPGEIVTIFGSGLGPSALQTATWADAKLLRTLGGSVVFFNGTPAPLIYVSETAVSAIVPLVFGQSIDIQVASNGGLSNVVTVPTANEAPGVFVHPNSTQAAALNQDGSYNIDVAAARGTYITFFITGAGVCMYKNAEYMDVGGIPPASPWAVPMFPVFVQFGDDPAYQAGFAALVFPGVVQVNALVYASAPTGDAVPLRVVFHDPGFVSPSGPTATVRIR